ncbi:translocation/assembly module TamB domain-containing protein [Wenzhouxiangella sp. AB-CW3]|uniref:translocation/assembly module TamB domain-containing protein n=1 Tax=Wenzhouxiangella sp. AB-CW3 TaxID=2771012 RepID=UPI00168A4212|nr:translocation/assembly module TamB domain-containing protein [Wenzhouxiangella sp. AB-CW3]QOC22249.1 translocation/assembly module TamB domain-containing protein [Wenzhouxiangella sp. AB-CW3]
MKKLLIIVAILLALLAAGLVSAWWWLTDTRSGAQWALNRAAPHLDVLSWEQLEGGLASGLVFDGVVLEQAGTRVTADRLELAARVHLLGGPRVHVQHLYLHGPNVHLPAPADEEREPGDPFDPGALALPLAIDIHDLRIERFELHQHDGETQAVDRLSFSGHYSDHIRIDRLAVSAPAGQLEGSGQWSLVQPYSVRLNLSSELAIDEETGQALDLEIRGPMNSLEVGLTAQGPAALSGQARVRGLPDVPSGRLRLEGQFADWPGLDLALTELDIEAEGDADDWSLVLDTRLNGMEIPPARWQLQASGDLARVDIESLRSDILDGEIQGRGWLDHGGETLAASMDLQFSGLDFTSLYPEWPDQARVEGELAARIDGDEIHLEHVDLSAPPTELKLTGNGRFVPAADELALDLEWANLVWPPLLDEGEPLLSSESGRVRLSGRISDWQLELDALLASAELPAGQLDLRATGSNERADFERLSLNLQEAGRLAAQGDVAWAPELETRIELTLEQLDPGRFVAQLPGRIDARATVAARQNERLQLDIQLDRLAGQLRDHALAGSGRLRLTDDMPEAARLDISLGDNQIGIASEDGNHWQWRLDADALDQLWPGISGSALLQGSLSPHERRLLARGEVEAAGFGDFSVERVHLDTELHWDEQPRVDASLKLSDLDLNPWDRIDQIEMVVSGGCVDHRMELNLSGMRGTLDMAGRGTLEGCLTDYSGWEGHIERLYLGETVAGNWQLAEGLPIRIDPDTTEAGPGCLRAVGDGDGRLCLRELQLDSDNHVRIGIHQVPMDLLLLPLDPVFTLTTPLSGQMDASWSGGGIEQVTGHLELEPGALRALGDDDDLLTIDSVRLDFIPQGGHGLLLDLIARLEGDSELTGQAHVIDLRDPGSTLINADTRLDLPDIGAFNHLVAELDQLGGRLHARLNLAGSVNAPNINGRLSISDGFLAHAPLGLRVTDIDFDLEGVTDHATLVGRMKSGDGHLNLDGALTQQDGRWVMEAGIEGDGFSFADVDWLRIDASPSIQLTGNHDRLDIDGDIKIDRLRGGLPPGAGERIRPSGDVVVLGETIEDDPDLPVRRLHGRLGIHVGDNARMSALGLQARLAGDLELLWNGGPEPRGRGVILIPEGSYRAYGQNLEIRDGEVLFTGHPLDNPRLDIRAVRDIFGDPRVEAAGVHIRGPARDPIVELYTDPPTTDEKALAYVVTGADFDHAGGQAAVNVGFYLLPRLFVSYGIGLFEAGNVLSGRYELSERWGVRVVSGERDTGVDIGFITDR